MMQEGLFNNAENNHKMNPKKREMSGMSQRRKDIKRGGPLKSEE
jgi:hypothetical protein